MCKFNEDYPTFSLGFLTFSKAVYIYLKDIVAMYIEIMDSINVQKFRIKSNCCPQNYFRMTGPKLKEQARVLPVVWSIFDIE